MFLQQNMKKNDFLLLTKVKLFSGIEPEKMQELILHTHAGIKHYEKGNMIFRQGDTINKIGIVLSGCLIIENSGFPGNKTTLSRIPPGEIFGEAYAICGSPLMINVSAIEKTSILFFPIIDIFTGKIKVEDKGIRNKIIKNLMVMTARKNLALSRRILHTSAKTIRGKLLSYFSEQMKFSGNSFSIPFNRQQLADYLNTDRSAMCAELSKMKKEGLISYRKNEFTITPGKKQ